jgi:hypothetical protein
MCVCIVRAARRLAAAADALVVEERGLVDLETVRVVENARTGGASPRTPERPIAGEELVSNRRASSVSKDELLRPRRRGTLE